MITTNTDGDPISQAFAAAMAEPSVMYSMKLFRNGSDLGAVIKRARLDLGAGQLSDDLGTFAACGVYQTQFSASLYDCPSILGDELEVRVGVLTGNAYEYVAVAYVTITEESVWKGVTDVRGVGRMGLMHAPHGLAEGDYQPAAIAAAIYAATGILVSIDARLTTQSVHADAGGTCRDALESMCARLGAYACELGEGVSVMPYSSTATGTIPTGHVTGKPELGALYEVDGITVEAGEESFVQGTGRVHIVDGTATATTAAATWGNMRGYAFTPATLNIALIDPRWTVADTLSVTLGEDAYTIPARGISITYDGGYFGTVSAAGLTAEAEEMTVEGPLTKSVGYARSVADEALEVAQATGQYFWHDSNGAHVSTDALNPTGASNSLWNSLGLLIRKAANYLVSITQSAIAFYDGNGNAASNITAQFGSSGATIGKTANEHIVIGSGGVEVFTDSSTSVAEFGSTSRVGTATDGHVELTSSSIDFYDGATPLASIDTSSGGYPTMWLGTHDFRLAKYESTVGGETTDVLSMDSLASSPNEGQVEILADGKSGTATLMVCSEDGVGGNFYIGSSKTTAMDDFDVLGNITTTGTSTASAHNGFRGRANLASTDDIDALYTTGIYYVGGSSVGGTLPSGITSYFSLITMGGGAEDSGTYVGKQMILGDSGVVWTRSYSGSPRTWSAWTQLVSDSVAVHAPTITNATASKFETRRQGNVVNLSVYQLKLSAALANGSSVSLGTGIIGANARPTNVVYLPLVANVAGFGSGVLMSIGTGGNVTVYNRSGASLGTGVNLMGNTSWVI